jgi:Response regulator containing CheY-like receiver, AAA-type ATPase, and DNA-binding domains
VSLQHSEVIRLDLPARHAYLHLLSETIAELLRQAGASNETLVYNIQLAAHEVCTNIVSHAYRNRQRNEDRINVTLTFHPQPPCLEIELHDNGETFDPELVPQPNLSEAQIHGYGLFFPSPLDGSRNLYSAFRWKLLAPSEVSGTRETTIMTTIMIVDDYAPTHRLMSFVLEQHGYTVITAIDGEQALSRLYTHTVDLVVTDLTMPRMDGIELVRAIRADER